MPRIQFLLSSIALLVGAMLVLSCGGASTGQGQLQSIVVSPTNADAQSFPDGEVAFTATGNYVNPSRAVTPQPVNWIACQKGLPTTDVSITTTGVAKCQGGFSGAYAINAWDISTGAGTYNCPTMNACGGGCTVEGTAQLTCP